jgi:hypothetical protein
MFFKKLVWNILSVVVLAAGLVGCAAPTALPTPTLTVVPTVDPKPTFDAVSTNAAQTVVADLTKNAPTATQVPTETLVPTNTPAPTDTPAPTSTPTRVFIPWTQTPTPTQAAYGCTVTDVSPKSGATLKVGEDFDGKWSLTNSGTKTWTAGNVDISHISGEKFGAGATFDLDHDVAPNGTYTFAVDMRAPDNDGSYSSTWGIYLEDGSVCQLSLNIKVTK